MERHTDKMALVVVEPDMYSDNMNNFVEGHDNWLREYSEKQQG